MRNTRPAERTPPPTTNKQTHSLARSTDGNGTLDSKELAALCKAMGSELDHNELVAALTTMDSSGDGKISYEEFFSWWSGWKHEKDDLKGAFAV